VLRFRPRVGADGLPTVEPLVDEHLADARELVALDVADRWSDVDGMGLLRLASEYGVLYVVTDAYHLPWVPYCRQRHLEHSFLVEVDAQRVTVTDAYRNETPWGAARPGRWELTPAELGRALPNGSDAIRLVPGLLPHAPAAVLDEPEDIDAYLAAYAKPLDRAAALDRLTMQTWLLARSRKLHASYVGAESAAAHLLRWDRLVEQTYLAARRVQRGRAEPPGLLATIGDVLAADRGVFGHVVVQSLGSDLRATVSDVVGAVLKIGNRLKPTTELTKFPTFSSFRMVEIVERLEQEFQIEFLADDLVPERLHRVEDLCELVVRARALVSAGGSGER